MIWLLFFILIQPLVAIIAALYAKLILWKMHEDLESWIEYGTGFDIVRCKSQRKEYQSYVSKIESSDDNLKKANMPKNVLLMIRHDLFSKGLFKPIYFKLLFLLLKGQKFK